MLSHRAAEVRQSRVYRFWIGRDHVSLLSPHESDRRAAVLALVDVPFADHSFPKVHLAAMQKICSLICERGCQDSTARHFEVTFPFVLQAQAQTSPMDSAVREIGRFGAGRVHALAIAEPSAHPARLAFWAMSSHIRCTKVRS